MKVKQVAVNNKKRVFIVSTSKGRYEYPFSKLEVQPSASNPIVAVAPDVEIESAGFEYQLKSGRKDTILIDQLLDYNRDPEYLCVQVLHDLTNKANGIIEKSNIRKRELARSLKTSPKQLYRLLDPAFYGKTINQMIRLLHYLGQEVEVKVKRAA